MHLIAVCSQLASQGIEEGGGGGNVSGLGWVFFFFATRAIILQHRTDVLPKERF